MHCKASSGACGGMGHATLLSSSAAGKMPQESSESSEDGVLAEAYVPKIAPLSSLKRSSLMKKREK